MKINPYIFRACDIRGIYPSDLNEKIAIKITQAFCFLFPFAKQLVVAWDSRLSSPALSRAVIETFLQTGKKVISIGLAPDPLFYFSIFHYHFDGGIMITASHNPKEYNGMVLHIRKPQRKNSEDVTGKDLVKIKNIVLKGKQIKIPRITLGKLIELNPVQEYIDYVIKRIHLKRPLKIIIDSGNGACGYLPEKVFRRMDCQVETIFGKFDGNFPHHLPDPYDENNLASLKKEVLKKKADVGFAFDADGDRVGTVDNQGRTVSGDHSLLMLAREVLKKKKGPIVHDVRISQAFLDEMKKKQIKTYFSVSHHNAIMRKILEKRAVFGGETSLHFFFPADYYLYDDAIFGALKIAEIVSGVKNFAKYIDSLPRYFATPEIFIKVLDKKKFNLIERMQKYLKERKYKFVGIDGARINFPHGWALIRASNTTPYIKCRFEGKTPADLETIKQKSVEIFEKVGIPLLKNLKHK